MKGCEHDRTMMEDECSCPRKVPLDQTEGPKVWQIDRKGCLEVEKRSIEQLIQDAKAKLIIIESELRGMDV